MMGMRSSCRELARGLQEKGVIVFPELEDVILKRMQIFPFLIFFSILILNILILQ